MRTLLLAAAACVVFPAAAVAQWQPVTTGTKASLRGLSVVDGRTAWASGTRGTVIHTTDGGATWTVDSVPGAGRMDLRGIHASSATVAHVAATAGRIWRTVDGGRTWTLRYQAADTTTFLDAITFWDDRHGVALGDPMGGRFLILFTDDGGDTWQEAPAESRPEALGKEAAFAASGTSLIVDGGNGLWLGTGGGTTRLHHSTDRGRHWHVVESPLRQGGSTQGIFSLAPNGTDVLAVGGDFQVDSATQGNVGRFSVPNRAWLPTGGAPPRGYRSGVARHGTTAIAVGPAGSDISHDGGASWTAFDATGFHAVRASADGTFFASGSDGRVAVYHAR